MAKRLSTVFHSLIFVLCLVGFLSVKLPQPRFQLDFYWFWLAGFLAIVLGLAIYVWAKLQLKNDGLVTAGPFDWLVVGLGGSLCLLLWLVYYFGYLVSGLFGRKTYPGKIFWGSVSTISSTNRDVLV